MWLQFQGSHKGFFESVTDGILLFELADLLTTMSVLILFMRNNPRVYKLISGLMPPQYSSGSGLWIRNMSKKQSMNALKLFVDLSQPWKQVTEVGITGEESIKSHKIVEDNTENHSRQKRSFSLESPTKSRPKLVTVWIYLRSKRFLR